MPPRPYFHSKATTDGGGGGGGYGSISGNSPTSKQRVHNAQVILTLNGANKFYVMKNRYGENGDFDLEKGIDLMCDMITRVQFDGSMDMFQETMKMKMVECLKDVLSGNIIPEGEVE